MRLLELLGLLLLLGLPGQPGGEGTVVWTPGPVLNQGMLPACTAYAFAAWFSTGPTPEWDNPQAQFWAVRQAHPEWTAGISLGAEGSLLLDENRLAAITYTDNLTTTRQWLRTSGPVVVSSHWYTGMDNPRSDGEAFHTGTDRVVHAYLCYGYDPAHDLWLCQNSWGTTFGNGGRFTISSRTLQGIFINAALPVKAQHHRGRVQTHGYLGY